MERIFRAEKMIERIKREGKERLLDRDMLKRIEKLDGKVGDDNNWASVVHGKDLVWIPADSDVEGCYVALCDCD